MKKKLKIKFVDFANGYNIENFYIKKRLALHFDVELSDEPDWIVYSVFGSEHLKYNNCVKLFWTGENQAPDFNFCDYAIGFEYLNFGDRYLRFPLWLNYPDDVENMRNKHKDVNVTAKTDFCSFVYSNSNASQMRDKIDDALSAYKKVNSGGRYRNNVGGAVADKLAFQLRHKFVIAFENASHAGYTTEKLVQAFGACAVPIYWGDPCVTTDFNPDSFVNCRDYDSFEAVVDRVREIDESDALWEQIVSASAMNDETKVDEYYKQLDEFLVAIFSQDVESAKRFSRDYWQLKLQRRREQEAKAYNRSLIGALRVFYNKYLYSFSRRSPWLWSITQKLMKKAKV